MVSSEIPRRATVPLFTPSPTQLRAGAVWVTISNWADALADRYGSAEVVTPLERLTPSEARDRAFAASSLTDAAAVGSGRVRHGPDVRPLVGTFAKDLRWGWWSVEAARRARSVDLEVFRGAPFVWQHHDLFARSGFAAARRLGTPLVLFVDAPQVWEARRWGVGRPGWGSVLEKVAERPQLLAADVVACVSDEVAQQVTAMTHGRANVLVTPCTAEVATTDDRARNRQEHQLDGRFVVGWVGSFRRFHHADMLVRVAAALGRDVDNVTLFMIGDGPTRAECNRLAAELGVDARFTGQVPNHQVRGLLQACDVGVVPAGEGDSFHYSPLKLKEFMAARLPTVVPRAGEMARTLKPDVDTLFFAPGDEAELRAQIGRLAADHDLRSRVARAGTDRLVASFSIGNQLAAVEALID